MGYRTGGLASNEEVQTIIFLPIHVTEESKITLWCDDNDTVWVWYKRFMKIAIDTWEQGP